MVKNFDEMQKLGQESANAATTSFGVVSKGLQAIATEVADYSKKSFEEGTHAFEQLLGTRSVEKAMAPAGKNAAIARSACRMDWHPPQFGGHRAAEAVGPDGYVLGVDLAENLLVLVLVLVLVLALALARAHFAMSAQMSGLSGAITAPSQLQRQ